MGEGLSREALSPRVVARSQSTGIRQPGLEFSLHHVATVGAGVKYFNCRNLISLLCNMPP